MTEPGKNNKTNPVKDLISFIMSDNYKGNSPDKVHDWLLDQDKADEKEEALREEFESLNYGPDDDVRRSLEAVNRKIGFGSNTTKKIPFVKYSLRVAAVLIPALIIIGSGIYMFQNENPVTDDSHFVEVTVPYGEHEIKNLACGSNVWVNSGSTVKYNDGESISERRVELSGEAYFSVEKINEKSFVVQTSHLKVKVTGTQFNVEAYPEEEKTIVTLDKGKIEVETEKHQLYNLEPNQQLVYNHQTGLGIVKDLSVDMLSDASGWKEWSLNFDEATLSQIFNKVEKRFDIRMEVKDKSLLTDEIYTVQFTKDDNVDNVMEILEKMVDDMSYQITDNAVIIDKQISK